MDKVRFNKVELCFFLIFSIISILPFCLVKYVPSLDGPQHLYNARLITELIKGNELISQYFRFNPVVVGNMSSLYILAILMFVLPAWLAEKIFLSLCVIGISLSFRYFIKSISTTSNLLYLLIFPFLFTTLFIMGYYNFCVAFIPFFLTLGYLKRHESHLGIRQAVWLTVLTLLIFLSHAVVFVFFGMIILFLLIFDVGYQMKLKAGEKKELIGIIKKYLIILAASLPAIVFWCLYYLNIRSVDQNLVNVNYKPFSKALEELYKLRILIGFNHEEEAIPNTIIFWTVIAFVLLAILPMHRFFPHQFNRGIRNNPDWLKWTFLTIILFLLAVFIPDRMVTGSMSIRLSILFFFGVITWISLQSMPRQIAILGLVLIMGAFTWHRVILLNYYQSINRDIAEFEKVGEFIKPQSILYPIDCSDSWFQPHFHCYLGVDKVLIDLANPQLNGPMPLLWNSEKMPRVLIGEFTQNQSGGYWDGGNINLTPVLSDYILIWKPQYLETNPNAEALLDKVSPYYYNQIALSESGDVVLYRLNNQNE